MDFTYGYNLQRVEFHSKVGLFQQGQRRSYNRFGSIANRSARLLGPTSLGQEDIKIKDPRWQIKVRQKRFVLGEKLESKQFFEKLNLHLFLRRKKAQSSG